MKYHIIKCIDGEKKNPPQFIVAANPIKEKKFIFVKRKSKVNYDINEETIGFAIPHTLEWSNVIKQYLCDKTKGIVAEWEPNINEYVSSSIFIAGEKHKGYIHKEISEQVASLKVAKSDSQGIITNSKKCFLPPVDYISVQYKQILQHKVILMGATKIVVTSYQDGSLSWECDNYEYFLFPEAEGEKIINEAIKLDPRKREFWEPNLNEYIKGRIGITHQVFGETKSTIHISRLLPKEVFDNINLLQ